MKKGDIVHSIAFPLARHFLDPLFGTHLAGCAGCGTVRTELNTGQIGLFEAIPMMAQNIFQAFSQPQSAPENMKQSYIVTKQIIIDNAESPEEAIAMSIGQPSFTASATPRTVFSAPPPQPPQPQQPQESVKSGAAAAGRPTT
jgi:hypothetical protein